MRQVASWTTAAVFACAVFAGCNRMDVAMDGKMDMKMDMTMRVIPPAPAEPGNRIGDATIAQLEVGKTSRAWIIAVLGEPTKSARVEGQENVEVLRYVTAEPSSGVISMIAGGGSRNVSTTYLVLVDDVLQRHWTDRAEEPRLLGTDKKSGGEKQGG